MQIVLQLILKEIQIQMKIYNYKNSLHKLQVTKKDNLIKHKNNNYRQLAMKIKILITNQ